jgi:hypothetical protein
MDGVEFLFHRLAVELVSDFHAHAALVRRWRYFERRRQLSQIFAADHLKFRRRTAGLLDKSQKRLGRQHRLERVNVPA